MGSANNGQEILQVFVFPVDTGISELPSMRSNFMVENIHREEGKNPSTDGCFHFSFSQK